MTPAELVKTTRERKRLSQRRLALRAGTSQSAIARIESGDEEVTWPRLRSLMLAMGEEPELSSRPLASRYDAGDLVAQRGMSPTARLESGLAFSKLAGELAAAAPREVPFDPRQMLIALAEHGVEFVVVGGVAVQAHGHGRSTRDLDVIPRPDLVNLSRLGEAVASIGARPVSAGQPVDATHPQLNVAQTQGAPRSYDELRARAFEAQIDGHDVAVAGLDDLIRMKRAAGRDVDLEDIGALTRDDEELEREARQST